MKYLHKFEKYDQILDKIAEFGMDSLNKIISILETKFKSKFETPYIL